jgi:hypothetical protein
VYQKSLFVFWRILLLYHVDQLLPLLISFARLCKIFIELGVKFNGIFSILAIVAATICYCMGHTDNAILFSIWSLILRD